MTSVRDEIAALEEQLRQAELGPDPDFFRVYVDDEMVFVADGKVAQPKEMIVQAHTPGKGQKFTRVDMSDMKIVEHGSTVVVTCQGEYEGPNGAIVLKYLRIWARKSDGWRIVAGAMI